MELRLCKHHGSTEFALYRSERERRRWRCKRCVGEAVTRRKQHVRQVLVREAGGRCAVCGYDRCVLNFHFHHVDPTSKSFPMSSHMGKSLAAFREELKKCVLLCANCHGEVEAGVIPSPPVGAQYGEPWPEGLTQTPPADPSRERRSPWRQLRLAVVD